MLYRRKLLLGLLEITGPLQATRLQKYVFDISRRQSVPAYDFVPYKYGCFSFDLYTDLDVMKKKLMITSSKKEKSEIWKKEIHDGFLDTLKKEDGDIIRGVVGYLHKLSYKNLIRHIYLTDPYYATKSEIAKDYLTESELSMIRAAKNDQEERLIASIGYEGLSLDAYLNVLNRNNVHILCDVRRNAFSMKRGFSKNQLQHAVEQLGITYIHLPELGIASEKRRKLETKSDYNHLFKEYRKSLKFKVPALEQLHFLVERYGRVVVTCFEANHKMCHRDSLILEYLALYGKDNLTVDHL